MSLPIAIDGVDRTSPATDTAATAPSFSVACFAVVLRVMRGQLCVGLPLANGRRAVPSAAPDASLLDAGLLEATRKAASSTAPSREILRIGSAGVRAVAEPTGPNRLAVISWAVARPLSATASGGERIEAEELFVPLPAVSGLDASVREIVRCAFDVFVDVTLADALTRRLLPRNLLYEKTDGFGARSPLDRSLANAADAQAQEREIPVLLGLLSDPFPLSQLRDLYEELLGAPLDRGNFRRQFHDIVEAGVVRALPIFEREVQRRAGQLFTFDRHGWLRFGTRQ